MASEIFREENSIVLAAAERMVALGSEASQRILNGKQTDDQDAIAQSILLLLTAYRQKTNLSTDDLESILYDLRELSGDNSFPTINPIVGQDLIYLVEGNSGGGSSLDLLNNYSILPDRGALNFFGLLTAVDDGSRINVNIGNGPNGYVIKMVGGAPAWASISINSGNATTWNVGTNAVDLGGTITSSIVFSGTGIASNTFSFGGTLTASGNNKYYASFFPTLTGRAGQAADTLFGIEFLPTLNTGTNGQTLVGVLINPGFSGSGTFYSLRVQASSVDLFSIKSTGDFLSTTSAPGATFTGTWTATANNNSHLTFMGSFTGRAGQAADTLNGYQFTQTLTTGTNGQTLNGVLINPTFSGTGTFNVLTLQNAGAPVARFTSNGSLKLGGSLEPGDGRAGNIYAGWLFAAGTAPLAGPYSGYGVDIYSLGGSGIPIRILSNSGNIQLMTFYDVVANLSHNHLWLDYLGSSLNTGLAIGTASQVGSANLSFRSSLWNGSAETKGYFTWRAEGSTSVNLSQSLNLYVSTGAAPSFGSRVISVSGDGNRNVIIGSSYYGSVSQSVDSILAGNAFGFGTATAIAGSYGMDIFSATGGGNIIRVLHIGGSGSVFEFVDLTANVSKMPLWLDQSGANAISTGTQGSSRDNSFKTSLWNGSSEVKGWYSWRADASTTTNLDQDLNLYASTGATPTFTLPVLKINNGGTIFGLGNSSSNTILTTSFTGGIGQNFHITVGGSGWVYRFFDNVTYAQVKAGTLGNLMLTIADAMITAPVAARIGSYIEIAPGGLNRINLFAGGVGTGLDIYNNGNSNYLFTFNDIGGGALYGNQSKFPLSMYQNGADATTTGSQRSSREFNFVASLWNGSSETKGWFSWRDDASTATNQLHTLSLYTSTGTSPSFGSKIFSINSSGIALFGAATLTASVSALVELQSTTAALLVTRMSTTQKNALTLTNGDGLVLYDNVLGKWQFRENGVWNNLGGLAGITSDASGQFYGDQSKTRWYIRPLTEHTSGTSGASTVLAAGELADGESVCIEITYTFKDDGSNTGGGGRSVSNWTKAAGTLVKSWEDDTFHGNNTGSTYTCVTSNSSGSIIATLSRVTGGNISWTWIAKIIHRKP